MIAESYADMSYLERCELVSEWLKDNPKFVRSLSYRKRLVMELRYGLGEGYFYTLKECGHIFKVTSATIRNLEKKALGMIDRSRATT